MLILHHRPDGTIIIIKTHLLAQSLIVQDVHSNPCCKQHKEDTQPQVLSHTDCTIEQCSPHTSNRHYLHSQRYCLVLPEIADIRPKTLVRQQPLVQLRRAAEIESRSQQQERSSWQQRKEYAYHAQRQGQGAQHHQQILHGSGNNTPCDGIRRQ